MVQSGRAKNIRAQAVGKRADRQDVRELHEINSD